MKGRAYLIFLEDMLNSIQKIENYISGMSFQDFQSDSRTVDTVLRNLEIIGEASKNIPPEIRKEYPDIL